MFKDPPRRILDLLFTGLIIKFFASLYFRDILPDQILGLNIAFCILICWSDSGQMGRQAAGLASLQEFWGISI